MKVLFAVDDSKFADNAVETVASRPWPADTEFRIITVLDTDGADLAELEKELAVKVKEILEEKARALRVLHPAARIDVKVFKGKVKDAIINEAYDWPANLIVAGSHGRKGFQKLLLGSVAESLLGSAPCPVEVVKIKGL